MGLQLKIKQGDRILIGDGTIIHALMKHGDTFVLEVTAPPQVDIIHHRVGDFSDKEQLQGEIDRNRSLIKDRLNKLASRRGQSREN